MHINYNYNRPIEQTASTWHKLWKLQVDCGMKRCDFQKRKFAFLRGGIRGVVLHLLNAPHQLRLSLPTHHSLFDVSGLGIVAYSTLWTSLHLTSEEILVCLHQAYLVKFTILVGSGNCQPSN